MGVEDKHAESMAQRMYGACGGGGGGGGGQGQLENSSVKCFKPFWMIFVVVVLLGLAPNLKKLVNHMSYKE